MGYFSETYTENLKPILEDYITKTVRGQNVEDVTLSYANRAQKNLWVKKPWCDLATDVDVSLVNNSYTFPANFGRIVEMGADLTGNGVLDYWFHEGGEYATGYKLRDSFTKALGHSWTITFWFPQSGLIKMVYQRLLEDLAGTGTEILFFPSNLMLLECQKIYLRERGNLKELMAANEAFESEFKEFCNCHQWINYNPNSVLRDRTGNRTFVESYTLDGSTEGHGRRSSMPNSFLG